MINQTLTNSIDTIKRAVEQLEDMGHVLDDDHYKLINEIAHLQRRIHILEDTIRQLQKPVGKGVI